MRSYMMMLCVVCWLQDSVIVAIHWYDGAEGSMDPLAPALAIAFNTGKVQLSRSLDDDRPIVLDTNLKISQVGRSEQHPEVPGRGGRQLSWVVVLWVAGGHACSASGTRAARCWRWPATRHTAGRAAAERSATSASMTPTASSSEHSR